MTNYHFLAKYDALVHGGDLLPTFCNNDPNVAGFLHDCSNVPKSAALATRPYIRKTFTPDYQSYLTSHAIHNDPMVGAKG